MPQFNVNPSRIDPYKKFKFLIKWDNKVVAGVSKMSPLKRTTDVILHREGGDANVERKSPGKTHYDSITLERGVTHDPEFEAWANLVFNKNSGSMSLKNFRKDIVIELLNEAGVPSDCLQGLSMLGLRVHCLARAGCGRKRCCHSKHNY